MSTTTSKTEARRRAREAKTRADAQRAAHDQRVEDAATEYYLADGQLADLRAQVEAAQTAVDATVAVLLDLGESADRVADLTGLTATEVRAAKRRSRQTMDSAVDANASQAAASSVA